MTSEKNNEKDSREQLIKAATKLFAKKGFNGTSVKELAEEAGCNVALVSYYFGGKEGLYRACFESFVEERLEFLDKKMLRPTSREEFNFRLQLFLETLLEKDLNNNDCNCILHRELASDDSVVREIFKKTVIRLFSGLIGYIEHGQKSGFLRKDIAPHDMCGLLMGAFQHRLRVDHFAKDVFGESLHDEKIRQRFIKSLMEMFLNGFATKEKAEEK